MINVNEISENYAAFDDAKIQKIAKSEIKGLRDEVIPIILEELARRNLDPELIGWVKAERRKLSQLELQELKTKVENCTCEFCSRNKKLKGYKFDTVIGALILRTVINHRLIVCEDCGRKKRKESAVLTLFLGWFSPRIILSYPFVMMEKIQSYIKEDQQSEELIEEFIKDNIGKITLGNDNEEVIQRLLYEYHQQD